MNFKYFPLIFPICHEFKLIGWRIFKTELPRQMSNQKRFLSRLHQAANTNPIVFRSLIHFSLKQQKLWLIRFTMSMSFKSFFYYFYCLLTKRKVEENEVEEKKQLKMQLSQTIALRIKFIFLSVTSNYFFLCTYTTSIVASR